MRRVVVAAPTRDPQMHRDLLLWTNDKLGCMYPEHDSITVANLLCKPEGDEILSVVVFNNWREHSCEAHIASDLSGRGATRDYFFTLYDFAFRHSDKSRIHMLTRVDNEPAIRLHEKLGHKQEGRLADAYGEGKDGFAYGYTRTQWKQGRWSKPSPKRGNS